MRRLLRWVFIVASLMPAACAAPPAQPTATPATLTTAPRPVAIDTDMAPDDWMAILYLLQRPDVDVKAITIAGTGEAHCQAGVRNALNLIQLSGRKDIPVACGRETPLQGDHAFPTDWRRGADNLQGLSLPASPARAAGSTAVELLAAAVASSSGIDLLTLGPLTNVAEALQSDPSLVGRIGTIHIMGGAVDVAGNVGVSGAGIANDVAEWNIYVDPLAASVVLESGAPITLVPLDATNHVPVTPAFLNRIRSAHFSPEATFVYDLLNSSQGFVESGGYFFWDPLAAAILTDESLAQFETVRLAIVTAEGVDSGQTRAVDDGSSVRVAVWADAPRFEQIFLDTLNIP